MKKKAKQPNDYPRVCFRIDSGLLNKIDSVRSISKLSYGQIIGHALRKYLPELEKFHSGK